MKKRSDAPALLLAGALVLAVAALAALLSLRPHAEESIRFEGPENYVSPTAPPPQRIQ